LADQLSNNERNSYGSDPYLQPRGGCSVKSDDRHGINRYDRRRLYNVLRHLKSSDYGAGDLFRHDSSDALRAG
jgi:hypothetical protein